MVTHDCGVLVVVCSCHCIGRIDYVVSISIIHLPKMCLNLSLDFLDIYQRGRGWAWILLERNNRVLVPVYVLVHYLYCSVLLLLPHRSAATN
jgi:hypothetical protein